METSKDYKKTVEDDIEWKLIDQLHSATLNFSNKSLELKKIYFVLIGIAVPTLIKLANDRLDTSLFVTLYILTLTFWYFDSYTYFYQEKLREKMDMYFSRIKKRHVYSQILTDYPKSEFTIEVERNNKERLWRSITNISVRLYFVLLCFVLIAHILFLFGLI